MSNRKEDSSRNGGAADKEGMEEDLVEVKEMKTARDSRNDACACCKSTKGFSLTVRGSWIDGAWSAGSIYAFDSLTKPANQFITANCRGCGEYARLTRRLAGEILSEANGKD